MKSFLQIISLIAFMGGLYFLEQIWHDHRFVSLNTNVNIFWWLEGLAILFAINAFIYYLMRKLGGEFYIQGGLIYRIIQMPAYVRLVVSFVLWILALIPILYLITYMANSAPSMRPSPWELFLSSMFSYWALLVFFKQRNN